MKMQRMLGMVSVLGAVSVASLAACGDSDTSGDTATSSSSSSSTASSGATGGAGAWETLTFDFANEAAGTAALNTSYTFTRASIFFNFGVDGATAGSAKTYYFDNVKF